MKLPNVQEHAKKAFVRSMEIYSPARIREMDATTFREFMTSSTDMAEMLDLSKGFLEDIFGEKGLKNLSEMRPAIEDQFSQMIEDGRDKEFDYWTNIRPAFINLIRRAEQVRLTERVYCSLTDDQKKEAMRIAKKVLGKWVFVSFRDDFRAIRTDNKVELFTYIGAAMLDEGYWIVEKPELIWEGYGNGKVKGQAHLDDLESVRKSRDMML